VGARTAQAPAAQLARRRRAAGAPEPGKLRRRGLCGSGPVLLKITNFYPVGFL